MSRLASLFINNGGDNKGDSLNEENGEKRLYSILFVDDETGVLKAMKRIFRKENYIIHSCESAEAGLEILAEKNVNVVISDYKMPGMNGADFLRLVKKDYPSTIRIMLTGQADVNAVMGAVNEGAVYKFITKPWNDDDLRLTISLALEQYDLISENKELKKTKETQKKRINHLSKVINTHRSRVGNLLLKKKLITKEDLDRVVAAQSKSNLVFPKVFTDLEIADEKTIIKVLKSELGIDLVYPAEFSVPKTISELIPKEICINNLVVPLCIRGKKMVVAMADPTDIIKVDDLKFICGMTVEPVLSSIKEIIVKIEEIYGEEDALENALSEIELTDPTENIEIIIEDDDEEDLEELLKAKDQPPAIRIVNAVISDALRHNASDVHIEPKTKHVMVRYRVDGLLMDKIHIPLTMQSSIVSRIKIMSELDIAERRKPQDGRITIKSSSRMVDMRISTLPTINGEKIVLRILDRNESILDIDDLGFSPDLIPRISRFINRPQGIILTTGPTGSGKTSTLYSLLQQGATITKNYTTIEDPVEYFMAMAEQVMVKEKIGLNFPVVLKSLLRQDPDVIMLGEIRDRETAEVAFHAALTGHLVLSTLHTNSSVASVTRLKDMGVKPYIISDALVSVIAQRLVRKICPHCIEDDEPDEEILRLTGITSLEKGIKAKKGKGCSRCNTSGYKGRLGLFEVFIMDDELRELIHKNSPESVILKAAKLSGMKSLYEDGIEKVGKGLTTLDEILRVLGPVSGSAVHCERCKKGLSQRYPFCPYCGYEVTIRCGGCNNFLDGDWAYCPYCGVKN